jgi:hypothetical protein
VKVEGFGLHIEIFHGFRFKKLISLFPKIRIMKRSIDADIDVDPNMVIGNTDLKKSEREHFVEALEKKIQGECPDERNYNAVAEELRLLTGRETLYLGSNAQANLNRDILMARKKAKTHSQRNRDTEKEKSCLKFSTMSENSLRVLAENWIELKKLELNHITCTDDKRTQCRGCKKTVCSHLNNYICTSLPVCSWCDTYVQPNPFNPINGFNPINRKTIMLRNQIEDEELLSIVTALSERIRRRVDRNVM